MMMNTLLLIFALYGMYNGDFMFKNILADLGLLTTTDEHFNNYHSIQGVLKPNHSTTVKINIEPSTASTQGIMETKTSATSVDTALTMLTSAIPLVIPHQLVRIAPVTAIPNIDSS